MSKILKSFTYDRNTLKSTPLQSSNEVERHIRLAQSGQDLSKTQSNIVGALRSYTGVIDANNSVTPIGKKFLDLFTKNPEDAWRWLLTRSLWLYCIPNGTQAAVNIAAKSVGQEFSFFRLILGTLMHLSALPGPSRYLYYDELCAILEDDTNWSLEPHEFFLRILDHRKTHAIPSDRLLLGDLEDTYGVSRDNLNTVLNKAFKQTGLFDYHTGKRGISGIALGRHLDNVLRDRIRFVIDHDQTWSGANWEAYLGLRDIDFPDAVSLQESQHDLDSQDASEPIIGMLDAVVADFASAGLYYDRGLVARFVAALLAKRFVILTGLSGSGKTKLAQAFSTWISSKWTPVPFRFSVGEALKADRISYRVVEADSVAVTLESSESGDRVSLPYGLIDEWLDAIQANAMDRNTSARKIRDAVTPQSAFSSQLSSFETHLKAAAFAKLERLTEASSLRHFEVVPVGPDWTSRESCFGYIDALNQDRFVRSTPILDLMLRALAMPAQPFFLILDEMNLSHVERYFSDFLSAAESGQDIYLHQSGREIDGVPPTVSWPNNLFVLGTVNVDETTYMFSPKVLDRANTIEFRVRHSEMETYLAGEAAEVRLEYLESRGAKYGQSFQEAAVSGDDRPSEWLKLSLEMQLLFEILAQSGIEFGFRTAREMTRFFKAFETIEQSSDDPYIPLDAQLLQKVLPRFSGSRRRIEGALCALAAYSALEREWEGVPLDLVNRDFVLETAKKAIDLSDPTLHPLSPHCTWGEALTLPQSYEKLVRMLKRLESEGFASYAES